MAKYHFLFSEGIWLGEGKIAFSISSEKIPFYTKWLIEKKTAEGIINADQLVEVQESEELVKNRIKITHIQSDSFHIELENDLFGIVKGKGVMDAKMIAWELREKEGLEGFEVYELQENGDYILHAEYSSAPDLRTRIEGRIWKKTTK